MVTINALFRLIVLAKRQGKGRRGNGVILTGLLGTLCDFGTNTTEIQRRLVISPDNVNVNRYADRLMKDQVRFPSPDDAYGIPVSQFQALVKSDPPDTTEYLRYLLRMHLFCMEALDEAQIPALTYSLLESIRLDQSLNFLFYQNHMIPKSLLIGDPAHPKRICLEALLTGLLYHAMMTGAHEDAHSMCLLSVPPFSSFAVFLLESKPPITSAELEKLLDLKQSVSMKERLQKITPEITDTLMLYQLEVSIRNRSCPAGFLREENQDSVFLIADGAMGKTTLMRQQMGLYLPLYQYKQEIREQLLPDCSSYLLSKILLKYYYGNAYTSWDGCIAYETESKAIAAFEELVRMLSYDSPRYTLLLDGTNEIVSDQLDSFVEEIAWIKTNCPALRLIISGRTVPDYPVFDTFDRILLLGIPQSVRDNALAALPHPPTDQDLLELLRSPMFLNLYLDERGEGIRTRGEILDTYFQNWRSPVQDNSKLLLFAVRYVLPFAANTMLHHHKALSRADLLDALDAAKTLYLDTERIYQNCIAPQHFRKTDLLNAIQAADLASLIIDHIGILEHDADGQLRFTHQYYRDYFAAKYILNIIEALVKGFGDRFLEDKQRIFTEYGLGEIWFWGDDSEEIYRLIGEITGDYKNIPDEYGLDYQETLLDALLDIAREIPHFRMVENVMNVMHLVRNGFVCGVDFSDLQLPFTMPEGTYFCDHGQYPSIFRNAKVLGVFASSIPENGEATQTVYPSEDCEKYYQNCDFTGAVYLDEDNREILLRYGAIV